MALYLRKAKMRLGFKEEKPGVNVLRRLTFPKGKCCQQTNASVPHKRT